MMKEAVIFSGVDGRLMLEASGYERPAAVDVYDANWLKTRVSIQSGPFSGIFQAPFSTYDFARLESQLADAVSRLTGKVEFESAEGDLAFSISFSNRGTAEVSGVAKPNAFAGARITFSFETDQSMLAEAVDQLTGLLRRLPVKEMQ
jgi:hypothetical protein